ncbi:hypothetical protein ACFQBQ_04515 [Granulicella cerasi]|uniref:Uncharacterized protein n=1 Tax=Granulicella cerasi TaxID=741063 RepID=A0ABW1Z605_9BACT|nr:hypothetical protein [Granulicella cerasi]
MIFFDPSGLSCQTYTFKNDDGSESVVVGDDGDGRGCNQSGSLSAYGEQNFYYDFGSAFMSCSGGCNLGNGYISYDAGYYVTAMGGFSSFMRMTLPADHLNCTTSTGVSFPAPPGFSVSNIAANGAANGLAGTRAAVAQGGYYDFQRFQAGAATQYYKDYIPAANIAVGAYVQATGASQGMASLLSNTYAFFMSNNGATSQQAQFRNLGFSLAAGKVSYSCQPAIP